MWEPIAPKGFRTPGERVCNWWSDGPRTQITRIAPERPHPRRTEPKAENPHPAHRARIAFAALVEERVDGSLTDAATDGHVRSSATVDRSPGAQRLAGVAAVMALGEMCLHRRAYARVDLAFEMLREEPQDIRTSLRAVVAERPNAGASSSRMTGPMMHGLTASTLIPRIWPLLGADSPSTSRAQDLALGGFQCVNGVRESGRQVPDWSLSARGSASDRRGVTRRSPARPATLPASRTFGAAS